MAAGFQFFTSDDAGAPVLTASAGKMAAVLDWVLVEKGGWESAYTGTNLRAYRSQTGNRFFLRVDDTQALYTRLRAYRTMSTVSAGTSQFPTNAQAGNINTWGVHKGYQPSTTGAQRYWGIRTDRWLVMVVDHPFDMAVVGDVQRALVAFGDFPSLCEADFHNTVLVGAPYADNYYSGFEYSTSLAIHPGASLTSTTVGVAMSGTPNGSIASPLCGLHAPYKGGGYEHYEATLALSDRLSFGPLMLGCGNSASVADNGVFPRGRFPNLSMLYGPASGVANSRFPAQDLVQFSLGSRTFLPICTRIYSGGLGASDTYLLEITDTDGAL